MCSGLTAWRKSEKEPQSLRVAWMRSSERSCSGISAATVFTPFVMSGRLLLIVFMAAPTAV